MTDAQVIDREAFDRLLESFGGDTDFLAEMLETYFEDSPQQLAAMEAAMAAGDAEQLRRAAHSLKSNSATFGALAFSAQARELEMMAKQGEVQDSEPKVASLIAEYPHVEEGLRELSQIPVRGSHSPVRGQNGS
jgi:HPt (histidine-containing phosphotransfer) domain-containing protein